MALKRKVQVHEMEGGGRTRTVITKGALLEMIGSCSMTRDMRPAAR